MIHEAVISIIHVNEFFELYHITMSIPIANKILMTHDWFAKKNTNTTWNAAHLDANWAQVRKARSALSGGLRGLSDALSYWSMAWDLVVPPPFGCRCSESTGPRGFDLSTNRKEIGLQVQRVPRETVHATQRALFKQNRLLSCI